MGAHPATVEFAKASDRLDGLRFSLHDKPGDAVIDNFRHGAGAERDDKCAASHIIHTVFILSAIGIAYVDRLSNIATEEAKRSVSH